jgi:hypothetical protein
MEEAQEYHSYPMHKEFQYISQLHLNMFRGFQVHWLLLLILKAQLLLQPFFLVIVFLSLLLLKLLNKKVLLFNCKT